MTPPKEMVYFAKCLAGVRHGENLLKNGNDDLADDWFEKVLALASSAPKDVSSDLVPLVLYLFSEVYQRKDRSEKAQGFRERASELLDQSDTHIESEFFCTTMAEVLTRLKEYRRAIPFWENSLRYQDQEQDAQSALEKLHELGMCYCRIGLKDHGLVPLRAAVKILESCPEHPMRSSILLNLGNALRKSSPHEAEACYREAAEIHTMQLHYESATPAWVNLAILCSEQGRHGESLELYQRVLKIRETAAGVPVVRVAMVHNNIACTYRRMGEYDTALKSVDRAIEMLSPTDRECAGAYSTRALILKDEKKDAEAVVWFEKAVSARSERSSFDLESQCDDLNWQIELLTKLGRDAEAAEKQWTLDNLRATMGAVPKSDAQLGRVDAFTGLVIVELHLSWRQRNTSDKDVLGPLIKQLWHALQEEKAGDLSGDVSLLESTTLIFNGPDAERVVSVVEPILRMTPACSGARISVRQGASHREYTLSHSAGSIN